ncbi:muscleblind-like 3 (Drosophila), isoform CRA_a [Mus musculus]|nr:muscleblind-like 3 (Drosophila), isoform CRA_a [Mus musculus]
MLHPSMCRFHDFLLQVPMMHGATPSTVSTATPPASNVPYVPTTTGNQLKY